MFNVLFDSIARAGGVESTDDWRIRESMQKAYKTVAVATPPGEIAASYQSAPLDASDPPGLSSLPEPVTGC